MTDQEFLLTEREGRVQLDMPRDDWETLLIMLGYALGAAGHSKDKEQFWRWVAFVNRLNATNPRFTPYEIPEEFRRKRTPAQGRAEPTPKQKV